MNSALQFGIIGAGRIGRVHAASLAHRVTGARLAAITDLYMEAAQQAAVDFDIPRVYADPQEMLQDPALDAVVICSSTDTHSALIQAAAAAGKQIFCEKPIALNLADIDAALVAVEQAGVKLQIGFNRRFDPNFRHIQEQVAAGAVGTPHLVLITSRDPAPPPISYIQVSGGIFLDMAIHDFDLARFLIGQEVVEVYAAGGVLVDPAIGAAGDIDTTAITLTYASGAICQINNSRQAVYGYDQRAEVFGSGGSLTTANNLSHRAVLSNAAGVHGANPLHFFLERYMDAYIAEMQAFVQAIQNDTPPSVSGQDGRIPVVMGLAAAKSYREKRPVGLSEIN